MFKAFKIIFINTFIFLFSVVVIEIFFGYWFDKDNYGPYMREHRLRKPIMKLNTKIISIILSMREIIMA